MPAFALLLVTSVSSSPVSGSRTVGITVAGGATGAAGIAAAAAAKATEVEGRMGTPTEGIGTPGREGFAGNEGTEGGGNGCGREGFGGNGFGTGGIVGGNALGEEGLAGGNGLGFAGKDGLEGAGNWKSTTLCKMKNKRKRNDDCVLTA